MKFWSACFIFQVALLTFTSYASAVLPPLYSTAEEIKAILQDRELGQMLPSGQPITAIRKNRTGYRLYTSTHQVQANIVPVPTDRPGPARFDVQFVRMGNDSQ